MEPIRVIVMDDSAFMRKIITEILESDERIEVVSTAKNGREGLNKIQLYSPDVVTIDVHMPVMGGLSTLEAIMETSPLPVIMLSGTSREGKSMTIEAVEKGAVDFIQKPSGPLSFDIISIKELIIEKVIAASTSKIIKNRKKKKFHKTESLNMTRNGIYEKTIVAIGTSTGGPSALYKVISDLPNDFISPIFIVQHMPEGFTKSLAERLNGINAIHVKEAEDGEIVKNHTAYIAPGNQHMKITNKGATLRVKLSKDKPRNNHRPSVDVLFESIADLKEINKIAVILTGMGNDGSNGIKLLKSYNKNTIIIAEAEETAIVYGMPKSAVETKHVDYIHPIHKIGKRIALLESNLDD